MEGASLTRQSSRERVQTPKALEWNKRRARAVSSDVEDMIEVIETVPAAPQSKRIEINAHLKERICDPPFTGPSDIVIGSPD
jgi:hypothetical protein